ELAYFLGLATARTVDEARTAQLNFKVGSENFIVAARDGDISWSTISRVPIRDPRARDLQIGADGIVSGHCPSFILPGDGNYEWTGDIDPQLLPADRNPAKGFIATANNDAVGVPDDGHPCNEPQYLGGRYDLGWREARIAERLAALVQRGGVTSDDLAGVQAESRSALGESIRDALVASLGRVIGAADGSFSAGELADLGDVRAKLMAWSLATPDGVGATDAGTIADSVATSVFAGGVTRIIPRAFGDEAAAIGVTPNSQRAAALLERALNQPSALATYDAATGDTVLWDDVTTPGRVETRDEIVARGFLDALA